MTNLSNIINTLPHMKSGNELIIALKILPKYTPEICAADVPIRLMALSDLYKVYIPSQMSLKSITSYTWHYCVHYKIKVQN